MANPFKRMCLSLPRQQIFRASQWNATRSMTSTSSRYFAEQVEQSPRAGSKISDQELDRLARQPGVRYTVEQESEDLSQVGVDNISSLAYRELEQHKELREIVRIAAWEMPLLSQHVKEFQPPTAEQVLRWRYTDYLGEPHPAARKVVVEFQPEKLKDLSPQQLEKLLKLAGARYNPSKRIVKMSCESFETQAQNKRYLADTINILIAEAKDLEAETFADVPLDLRHHRPRPRYEFPKAWIMTPERKAELEQKRGTKQLEDGIQREAVAQIEAAPQAEAAEATEAEENLMAAARIPLPVGQGQSKAQR